MVITILSIVLAIVLGLTLSEPLPPAYLHCGTKPPATELVTSSTVMLCPKLNSSKFVCDSKRYTISPDVSQPRGHPYSEFVSFLNARSKKILLFGDSITYQMHLAFVCSLESDMTRQGLGARSYIDEPAVAHVRTRYLSEMNHPFRLLSNANGVVMHPMEPSVDDMIRLVLENNYTHLVLNTGPWYIYKNFQENVSGNWRTLSESEEALPVFRSVFAQGSPLLMSLRELHHKHKVTILWRDNAPAGDCKKERFPYYRLFPEFNSIAREAIRSIGGHVLHGVWEHAVHRWQDHMGKGDFLHWCLMRPNSVPSHWNELLMNFVYKQLK